MPLTISDLSPALRASLETNVSCKLGAASLNSSHQKMRTLATVIFEENYTKARINITHDLIQYGWTSNIYEICAKEGKREEPVCIIAWSEAVASSEIDPFLLENNHLISEFDQQIRDSVQHVDWIFDNEKTFDHALLKEMVVKTSLSAFKNLKNYTLTVSSV